MLRYSWIQGWLGADLRIFTTWCAGPGLLPTQKVTSGSLSPRTMQCSDCLWTAGGAQTPEALHKCMVWMVADTSAGHCCELHPIGALNQTGGSAFPLLLSASVWPEHGIVIRDTACILNDGSLKARRSCLVGQDEQSLGIKEAAFWGRYVVQWVTMLCLWSEGHQFTSQGCQTSFIELLSKASNPRGFGVCQTLSLWVNPFAKYEHV